jgi:catechol 2,3-dioxygenase-like lactoylglutathione lyase family enzyme
MSSIRHCGIVCQNLDKMTKFYKLLGFEEFIKSEVHGKFVNELIGLHNSKIKIVKLKLNNSDFIIEFLQYNKIRNSRVNTELYEQGTFHIALTIDDIDKMFEILKLNGAEFLTAPLMSEFDNVKLCFCKDPEGNFIELVEVL